MTAKDKAKELVNRFLNDVTVFNIEKKVVPYLIKIEAKQCALLCVSEIVQYIVQKRDESMYFEMDLKYWEEVKQEIGKL